MIELYTGEHTFNLIPTNDECLESVTINGNYDYVLRVHEILFLSEFKFGYVPLQKEKNVGQENVTSLVIPSYPDKKYQIVNYLRKYKKEICESKICVIFIQKERNWIVAVYFSIPTKQIVIWDPCGEKTEDDIYYFQIYFRDSNIFAICNKQITEYANRENDSGIYVLFNSLNIVTNIISKINGNELKTKLEKLPAFEPNKIKTLRLICNATLSQEPRRKSFIQDQFMNKSIDEQIKQYFDYLPLDFPDAISLRYFTAKTINAKNSVENLLIFKDNDLLNLLKVTDEDNSIENIFQKIFTNVIQIRTIQLYKKSEHETYLNYIVCRFTQIIDDVKILESKTGCTWTDLLISISKDFLLKLYVLHRNLCSGETKAWIEYVYNALVQSSTKESQRQLAAEVYSTTCKLFNSRMTPKVYDDILFFRNKYLDVLSCDIDLDFRNRIDKLANTDIDVLEQCSVSRLYDIRCLEHILHYIELTEGCSEYASMDSRLQRKQLDINSRLNNIIHKYVIKRALQVCGEFTNPFGESRISKTLRDELAREVPVAKLSELRNLLSHSDLLLMSRRRYVESHTNLFKDLIEELQNLKKIFQNILQNIKIDFNKIDSSLVNYWKHEDNIKERKQRLKENYKQTGPKTPEQEKFKAENNVVNELSIKLKPTKTSSVPNERGADQPVWDIFEAVVRSHSGFSDEEFEIFLDRTVEDLQASEKYLISMFKKIKNQKCWEDSVAQVLSAIRNKTLGKDTKLNITEKLGLKSDISEEDLPFYINRPENWKTMTLTLQLKEARVGKVARSTLEQLSSNFGLIENERLILQDTLEAINQTFDLQADLDSIFRESIENHGDLKPLIPEFQRARDFYYTKEKYLGKTDGFTEEEYENVLKILNNRGINLKTHPKEFPTVKEDTDMIKRTITRELNRHDSYSKCLKDIQKRGFENILKALETFINSMLPKECSKREVILKQFCSSFREEQISKMKYFFFSILQELECVFVHENFCKEYEDDKKLQAAIEMMLLELTDLLKNLKAAYDVTEMEDLLSVIIELPNFPMNGYFVLRNFLAHGDSVVEITSPNITFSIFTAASNFLKEGKTLLALINILSSKDAKNYIFNSDSENLFKNAKLIKFLDPYLADINILSQSRKWKEYLEALTSRNQITNLENSQLNQKLLLSLPHELLWNEALEAIVTNNIDKLKHCCQNGVPTNNTDQNHWNLLHHAIVKNAKEIVEYFIDQDIELVSSKDVNQITPFHLGLIYGKLEIVQLLYKSYESFGDSSSFTGEELSYFGEPEVFQYLLSTASSPKILRNIFTTVGGAGAFQKFPNILEKFTENELQEAFVSVTRCTNNLNILKYAVEELKLPIDERDAFQQQTGLANAVIGSRHEIVAYLISKGADVNIPDNLGRTPLHHAVLYSDLTMCEILIKLGSADITKLDNFETNILQWALIRGSPDWGIINYLLEVFKCSSVCSASDAIHPVPKYSAPTISSIPVLVVQKGNLEAVKLFAFYGADFSRKSTCGTKYPIQVATLQGKQDIVKYLVEELNVDPTPALAYAGACSNLQTSLYIFEKTNSDVTKAVKTFVRPMNPELGNFLESLWVVKQDPNVGLHQSVEDARDIFEIGRWIHEKNANVLTIANDDMTVLHRAARFSSERLQIVKYLVEVGANVNACNSQNKNPIFYCTDKDVLKYLCECGSDLSLKSNVNGYTTTVLGQFVNAGRFDMVEILIDFGANPNIKVFRQASNEYPIHWALSQNDGWGIVRRLIEKGVKCIDLPFGPEKKTLLHRAVVYGGSGEVGNMLLEKGHTVDIPDDNGCTPLHYAAMDPLFLMSPDLLRRIVEKADIFYLNNEEKSPLVCAVEGALNHKITFLVKIMLERIDSNDTLPPEELKNVLEIKSNNAFPGLWELFERFIKS